MNKMKDKSERNYSLWKWDIPKEFNIGSACSDRQVDFNKGNNIAMVVEDDIFGTSQITYQQLSKKTNQFSELIKSLNLIEHSRVLIRIPNCLNYPISFLGTIKSGHIAVPTSTLLTSKEIIYLAKDSKALVLVTDYQTWQDLIPMIDELTCLKTVFISGNYPEKVVIDNITVKELDVELGKIKVFSNNPTTLADDPAYLVYTSGTTGYPKGVLHANRALLGRGPASKYWFNFSDSNDRILHTGKFNWTYVLGSALMDPLYHGKTVIVYEGKNDPSAWLNLIKKHRATIFVGVPSIYRQILQKTQGIKKDVETLRHCMSAGEHLSDEIFDQWTARFDLDIYEAVGMSEFSYYISQSIYRPIRPGSAGFPQPGHNIELLDIDTLKPVKTGEEGMICIPNDDPGLFIRYWNLEEETEKHKHRGWFFTGDYARYDKDGYIWFLGRKDDIIKSFGYRVSPYEIERIFKSHPEVSDCAAIGEVVGQDKILVVVYIILNENSQINPNDLVLYGRKNLATYKSPKITYIVNSLPRTKNGKILRKEINKSIALGQSDIR
jgi:acetyl-CoA synthetase|tara:strand:- start:1051 stop:2700 length:1650 start_codon:yes stop_codon:yes gene_type:complete